MELFYEETVKKSINQAHLQAQHSTWLQQLSLCVLTLSQLLESPLWCSCLENPMDGGAWWAAVHGVARVGHDWATSFSLFTFMHWRRKWRPTPVFLPGESWEWGSLVAAVYGVTQSWTRLKRLSSSRVKANKIPIQVENQQWPTYVQSTVVVLCKYVFSLSILQFLGRKKLLLGT